MIKLENFLDSSPGEVPQFDNIQKWHHPDTLEELCRIRSFILSQKNANVVQFLNAVFSAILTSTTARKGKEHGFFADNTPLSKGETAPPYENAFDLFLHKLTKNVDVLERLYSSIERTDRNPEEELNRARTLRVDVTQAQPKDYGVEPGSVAGIITSPPYLCMSDYSLGQRLSYYWLFPDQLADQHNREIGARRRRTQETALQSYLDNMSQFATLASKVLRSGGFLATVLGAPVATAFKDADVLNKVTKIFHEKGFSSVWSTWRSIHWHRNHGYACLKEEQISVYSI